MKASEKQTSGRSALRWIAWAYCLILVLGLLAPFDFYRPVRQVPNGVKWLLGSRGIELTSNGIVLSESPAAKLAHGLRSSAGFSVEAWVASTDPEQGGPARIVTYSFDKSLRNFTLGQNDSALVFRLRTARTDLNGMSPQIVIEEVFSTSDPTHVVVTYDRVMTRVHVDGRLAGQVSEPAGDLNNWDAGYRLALGNELTGNRPWLGRIHFVALYGTVLSEEEIRRRSSPRSFTSGEAIAEPLTRQGCVVLYTFSEGKGSVVKDRCDATEALDLSIPPMLATSNEPFLHPPYRYVDPRFLSLRDVAEIVANVALFVPLGFFFGRGVALRSRADFGWALGILLAGVLLSLGLETTQYFIRGRESSLGDVFHNGLGAAVGVFLASRAGSRL